MPTCRNLDIKVISVSLSFLLANLPNNSHSGLWLILGIHLKITEVLKWTFVQSEKKNTQILRLPHVSLEYLRSCPSLEVVKNLWLKASKIADVQICSTQRKDHHSSDRFRSLPCFVLCSMNVRGSVCSQSHLWFCFLLKNTNSYLFNFFTFELYVILL